MKDIRIQRLSLEHFKGWRRLDLEFDGRSASIYGDNAVGKTSIYDGLTWLLFGKDSQGQSSFDIKPLDQDGKVADHGAVTSVEAVMNVGGQSISLRRTYFEKWSAKRGSAEESFDGNTSEYFVDGVPVKKYEYERRVSDLIPEELFRMLTSVTWFCGGLDWRQRRKTLFEVCGIASDGEMLTGTEEFAPLAAAKGGLSLEDFKAKLLAERKGLNGARNAIPARLDECQKAAAELEEIDFAAIRGERTIKAARLEQLQAEVLKLCHGALLDSKRNDLLAARNELAAYINSNTSHRASQIVPVTDERPAMRAALGKAKEEFSRWTALEKNEKELAASQEEEIEKCREAWKAADAEAFTGDLCPACGQPLPPQLLEDAKRRFDAEKEKRKRDIVSRSELLKGILEASRKRRETYIESAVAAENEAARLAAELESYVPDDQPEITDLPGYMERVETAQAVTQKLEGEIAELEGESSAIRQEIDGKIAALRQELDALDRELAKEEVLAFTKQRADALRKEAAAGAERIGELDKLLYLCDEFTRYKARHIESDINSRFRAVKFQLFQEQVNGGLADCCEASVNGVPYSSLNNGARVNAGLDVIEALSEHYDVRVPLFVDNAESVTRLLPLGAQVIRLVVSEADKRVRCEFEA